MVLQTNTRPLGQYIGLSMNQEQLELYKYNELFSNIVTVKKLLGEKGYSSVPPIHPIQAKLEDVLKLLDEYHNIHPCEDTIFKRGYENILFFIAGVLVCNLFTWLL